MRRIPLQEGTHGTHLRFFHSARLCGVLLLLPVLITFGFSQPKTVQLADLDLSLMTSGWGKPAANRSIVGNPLSLGGRIFSSGVGTHAESEWRIQLDGKAIEFRATLGIDDEVKPPQPGSIEFIIFADDREAWRSAVMKAGQPPKEARVKLTGVKSLRLVVDSTGDGIDYDHADWAEAVISYSGAMPRAAAIPAPPPEKYVMLTPPAPRRPLIHGPQVYGVRPGSPFLYRIPATGDRPMKFSARALPEGLSLDAASGIISGRIADRTPTKHTVMLVAENAQGKEGRELGIVVGDTLSLTPQMGWNDWYTHYDRVTDATVRQAADFMISSGMADYGYQYVNIDDCWMNSAKNRDPRRSGPLRDANGNIQANSYFPDMKALTEYIHSKGLKAGLYTSPGPTTCAGFAGSYQHEEQDVRQFAAWGFDFLKYDWCSYTGVAGGKDLASLQKPYRLMSEILRKIDRDIVLNFCQYGMGDVWKWGAETGGNSWRTTGDLGVEGRVRLPGFYRIGMANAQHWEYGGPGHWNDPDYILIGWYGNARAMGQAQKADLTANECYSYMSMWSLMAAPLFFSGDMSKLDAFTLNVLCNAEVIDIDQDILGKQGRIVRQSAEEFVLAKPLADGSVAVGLFNLDGKPRKMEIRWEDLEFKGACRVRDLWRQKDVGTQRNTYAVEVPRHGVSMVKIMPQGGHR
jgi:alpha-galactosidase